MSSELLHRVRSAQIRAGERAATAHLREMGLLACKAAARPVSETKVSDTGLEWQDPDANLTHAEYYNRHGTLNDWRILYFLDRDEQVFAQVGVPGLLEDAEDSYPWSEFLKATIEEVRSLASEALSMGSDYVDEELRALADRLEVIQEHVKAETALGIEALQKARKCIYVP